MFIYATEIKDWLLNTVAPAQTLVSLRENLDWRLMSAQAIKKDDCIRFVFQNPYWADAPETYKSFDMTAPYSQPCEVSHIIHTNSILKPLFLLLV